MISNSKLAKDLPTIVQRMLAGNDETSEGSQDEEEDAAEE